MNPLDSEAAFKHAINYCRVQLSTKKFNTKRDVGGYLGVDLTNIVVRLSLDDPLPLATYNHFVVPKLEELHKNRGKATKPVHVADSIDEVKSVYEQHPLDLTGWLPLIPNPKQTAKLYPFQTKEAKNMMYRLFVENRRAYLLRASVGVGKTFMYGQLIRWIFDSPKEPMKGCISPWPVLIITKASIVEQTRRVLVNLFGLDGIRQVSVINYDALRSTKGLETMIEETKTVQKGEIVRSFKWRPFLRPRIIIVDESQCAKNKDAQQAEIIAKLSEVEDEHMGNLIKLVFSSATPFTTVEEARYFCINAAIPYKMI